MDRQEMLERLDNGESPLDVSIQKWKDIVLHLITSMDLSSVEYHTDTCALCETSFNLDECIDCEYRKFYGSHCDGLDNDTAWTRFDDAFYDKSCSAALQAAKDMVKELEAIKNAKKDN